MTAALALALAVAAQTGGAAAKPPASPALAPASTTAKAKASAPASTGKASAPASASAKGASKAAAKAVPVEVHAASIEYRYKERRTVMTGDPLVTLTRQDATLVCRRLVAEMDAGGQIARATCEGDVKLTRGERVVTCATATFENAIGRVTCDGRPELRDGGSVLNGEQLVYDLDQDRVTLTRASGTVMQSSAQDLPIGRGGR